MFSVSFFNVFHGRQGLFLVFVSSSMEEKMCLLKRPSSSMDDECFINFFYLPPWRKIFSVKISFFVRGRQAFFLHFLASSMDDEHSFLILLSSPVGDECSFFVFR